MAETYPTTAGKSNNPITGLWQHWTGAAGVTGFGSASTAEQVAAGFDGTGKTVIITGASAGLGAESARVLAARGCEVIMAVRDMKKAQAVADKILAQHPGSKVIPMELRLDSLKSVRAFAGAFLATGKPLNILMLNAGVMACPFTLSQDGHELQFATNHLGHFLLTTLLLPAMEATARQSGSQGRVVVLASSAHFGPYSASAGGPIRFDKLDSPEGYRPWMAYGQSKLSNVLFARELNRRLQEGQVPVVAAACHPGAVVTELGRFVHAHDLAMSLVMRGFKWMFKAVEAGASTQVYLATAPSILAGEYYADCNPCPSLPASHDAVLGRKLWEVSEKLCSSSGQQ